MSVQELNREQLDELKEAYFWNPDTMDEIPEDIAFAEEIPDEVIFEYFAGISFVNDDFFATYIDSIPQALPF